MTSSELNDYAALKADIKRCKEKLREISSSCIKSPSLSAGGGKKMPSPTSTEDRYIKNIDLKEMYEKRIQEDLEQIKAIESYISRISDKRTKVIFEMRIYDQKKWWIIAAEFGGGNTDESVQKIYRRYLEKHPN